ncbi:hypothetical protein CBX96_07425 [Shewanella sp. BC20]|uniref:hypothetical protein n=1 Tax=Shewanella sp. BC20 TaxID=2004459 RepID=UPI000D64E144|nr:hypothetical protein [Shewanella sp. BC20]PWF64015.1 hypothetical protein CBX96_07425 [Shewanella sp. BC20]
MKKNDNQKVKGIIARSQNEASAQYMFFNKLTAQEIYQCFQFVTNHPFFYDSINLSKKVPLRNFYKTRTVKQSIEKNISWLVSLVEYHAKSLKFYQSLRVDIDLSILNGDWDSAYKKIDKIDEVCGVSIWSQITRNAIESFVKPDGDAKSINLFENVNTEGNPFLQYISFYSSGYFNDPEIYLTSKNTHANDIRRSAPSELVDFFMYRFFRLDSNHELDFEYIIDVEKNSSIIDIYQLLTFCLEYVIVGGYSFENKFSYKYSYFIKALKLTGYNYERCFSIALGADYNIDGYEEEFNILDNYTKGNYSYVIRTCLDKSFVSLDFSFAELTAKSLTRKHLVIEDGFISKIILAMVDVLLRNTRYETSLSYLSCLSNAFRTIEWFRQLGYFTERESKNKSYSHYLRCERGMYLFSKVLSPKRSIVFPELKSHVDKVKASYPNSLATILLCNNDFKYLSEIELDVDTERFKKYLSLSLIKDGKFNEAKLTLESIINSNDSLLKIECLKIYSNLLIKMELYDELLILVVDNSLANPDIFSIFDTDLILKSIGLSFFSSNKIELPILYSLHSQYVNSEFDSNLKFSFEKFLNLNGFVFPNELFGKGINFGDEKVKFFLRWVCTTENMKLYLEFNNSRELEECRLEICNYLLEISDNKNVDDLQYEIKNISKNLIIRQAVQHVENSRIYVDSNIFKGRNSTPYKLLFERYVELSSNSQGDEEDEYNFKKVLAVLPTKEINEKVFWKSTSVVFLPETKLSPKTATFLSLAKLMRQEFTYGERGINNYLSTRIRHGVLPTAIRRSSILEGIHVSAGVNVDSYRESTRLDNMLHVSDSELDIFLKMAKKFTRSLEELISVFNDRKLQIYTLESPLDKSKSSEAIFNYSISPLETYALQLELPVSPSYEDFVKVITDWLWIRTDYILDEVKNYIKTEFNSSLSEKFEDFISEIQSSELSPPVKRYFANSVSRAKAAISSDLETIKSWFEHVDSDGDGEFDIGTAIEIAKRSLSINIEYREDLVFKMPQRNVSYWVDVFFILFENAISKSQLEREDLNVKLLILKAGDNSISITCSNNTREIVDVEKKNLELKFYKDAYGDEELTKDAIQSEGGTGFFKIWKIIERDLGLNHRIDFGFDASKSFFVNLNIELRDGV